jgi:hypothetical protein
MTRSFQGMDRASAAAFAARWLPAWTGNDPERLASFYSADCVYTDASTPAGVRGRPALRAYFTKLLARNPSWVWTQADATPMDGGFVNHFRADIPVADRVLSVTGVCLVWVDADGLIARNDVFFDRSELLAAIAAHRESR